MTKTELQSALAEATQTDKKNRWSIIFLDTLSALAYKEIKRNGEFVLPRFGKAGEAEEEGAYGL
jgi:hypothetical protein